MIAKFTSFIALFILCLASVSAASFEVRDIKVSVTYPAPYDRFSDRVDLDDGLADGDSIVADIFPGSEVEFIFTVENLLHSSINDDGDVNNIVGTITVEDLDDGDDVEVETDDVDLDAGDNAKLRTIVKIPEKVEAQEYDVEIKVEGDTNSSTESVIINLILEVRKESSDLKVTEYRVTPALIGCDRNIRLYAVMTNLGKDKESNAAFEARSDPLGIAIKRIGIELTDDPFDEDSEYVLNVPLTIPKDVAAGKYTIDYNAWFQNQILMDKRSVELTVTSCAADATTPPVDETRQETGRQQATTTLPSTESGGASVGTGTIGGTSTEPVVSSSVETPFTSSPVFITGMILLNLLVLGVIIIAVANLITLRKHNGQDTEGQKKSGNEETNEE